MSDSNNNSDVKHELLEQIADLVTHATTTWSSVAGEAKYIVGGVTSSDIRSQLLSSLSEQRNAGSIAIKSPAQLGPWNTGNVSFGNNFGIVAHAQLTLYSNGAYNFNGNFHNPDWVPYDVAFGWVVVDLSGTAFVFKTSGKVAGAITPGSQDYNWSNAGTNPAIAAAWSNLEARWQYRWEADINVDLGTLLNSIINYFKSIGVAITTIVTIVG